MYAIIPHCELSASPFCGNESYHFKRPNYLLSQNEETPFIHLSFVSLSLSPSPGACKEGYKRENIGFLFLYVFFSLLFLPYHVILDFCEMNRRLTIESYYEY